MFKNDLTRCPNCGKRVTAYAAGCDECGATLDIARFRKARQQGAGSQARSAGAQARQATENAASTVKGWVRRATSR